jgi:hypothetical protein
LEDRSTPPASQAVFFVRRHLQANANLRRAGGTESAFMLQYSMKTATDEMRTSCAKHLQVAALPDSIALEEKHTSVLF